MASFKYAQIDSDTYLKYNLDAKVVEVISKSALQFKIDSLTSQLNNFPSDQELLKWAKDNYPGLDKVKDISAELKSRQSDMDSLSKATLIK